MPNLANYYRTKKSLTIRELKALMIKNNDGFYSETIAFLKDNISFYDRMIAAYENMKTTKV